VPAVPLILPFFFAFEPLLQNHAPSSISILSSSLGRFFRISLSKGEEVISLREEIEHVTSYLEIQSIRYGEKLNYDIEVDLYLFAK